MTTDYRLAGLAPQPGNDPSLVRALQSDLRALGYLDAGIDGRFGPGTDLAVRRLRHDLLTNEGNSTGGDGNAPVSVASYNEDRVAAETGPVDAGLADCIREMLDDADFPKLPRAADAVAANADALARIAAAADLRVPAAFLLAIFAQESGSRHFSVPAGDDTDDYVCIGLDGVAGSARVTSRGYGIGQFTIFHHPPRPEEVDGFILDPVRNTARAAAELLEKMERFVVGGTPGTTADDRLHEVGGGPVRRCVHPETDPRALSDCHRCAVSVAARSIGRGTQLYVGAGDTYGATRYQRPRDYQLVPDRQAFGCDWPYAARRYNGSGPDSYNYQAQVLLRLAGRPVPE